MAHILIKKPGFCTGVLDSSFSLLLSSRLACYLRIDTIESAIRKAGIDDIGSEGYGVALCRKGY